MIAPSSPQSPWRRLRDALTTRLHGRKAGSPRPLELSDWAGPHENRDRSLHPDDGAVAPRSGNGDALTHADLLKLNSGSWRIIHRRELVATFLLPLPDPLPFPDGTMLPTYERLEHASIEGLGPWLEELELLDLDTSTTVPCTAMRPSAEDSSMPANWSNKFALNVSVQIHQTFSDASWKAGLDPALRLARIISGPSMSTQDKARALDDLAPPTGDSSELRDIGLGAVTVAECAVGLRLIGDLPDMDEPLIQGVAPAPPFGPIEADRLFPSEMAMWPWRRLFAQGATDTELVERRIRNALTLAIDAIASIQRASQAIRRDPMQVLTQQRLPLLVPVVLRSTEDIGADHSAVISLLATKPPSLPVEPLTDAQTNGFNRAREQMDGGPFSAHLDMHREAHVALQLHGDYRLACLLSGISAESLLDELILHLMWEEALTPEEAANTWIDTVHARVRNLLPNRLGGSWDFTLRGPAGVWSQDVANVRNRVAHTAYAPTADEAAASFRGLNELVTFLCDRLAHPDVLKAYPRTALSLAGAAGLQRRGAYTRRVRELESDPREVPWIATFTSWREAWQRLRQDVTVPRVPEPQAASLLMVRHPDRTVRWVLHDRPRHLAIETEVPQDERVSGLIEKIHAFAGEAAGPNGVEEADPGSSPDAPISLALEYAVAATPLSGAVWVEEYHHVPMTQVMVDRSDYSRPT